MIWTIVLWLGMQGQAHVPLDDPGIVPHVFEIEIKQKLTGLTEICSNASFSGNPSCSTILTPAACPVGNYCKEIIDVTRELWMDGKRLGIIKGLE